MKYTLFLVGVFILSANGFAAPDAQKRVALVIGNSAYQSAPLKTLSTMPPIWRAS